MFKWIHRQWLRVLYIIFTGCVCNFYITPHPVHFFRFWRYCITFFFIFSCSYSVADPSQIISQHFWPRKPLWLLCFRFDWFAFVVYIFSLINHAVIKSITGFKLVFVQLLKKFIKILNQAQVNRGNPWYCKLYLMSDWFVLINIKVLKSRNVYKVK